MTTKVIIAGAGPVGLMLACELRLQNVPTIVLERRTEPDPTIKAGSINLATAEALRRRGFEAELRSLHDEALLSATAMFSDPGQRQPDVTTLRKSTAKIGGHFAGLFLLDPTRIPPDDPDWLATSGKGGWMLSQQMVEQLLRQRLAELGGELRTGTELIGFTENTNGIRVELSDGTTISGHYLIGCDGGRSRVRKLAGFEFPGTEPTITGHQALVDIADPEKLPNGWTRTPTGMLTHGPIPGRISTVEFDGPPEDRDAPITLGELQDSLRRVSGTEVTITKVHTATRYTDNARQASTYRIGRVFLAGDAAHVHSPFGGQGLNLGIGDAINLGWKLALVIQGKAQETLLDTYTEERHPIGARILELTRAQVTLMRPGFGVTALRDIVTELMDTVDGNAYFTKMITGMTTHYDLGAGHELLGKQMPALTFTDGIDLVDHCHNGKAVLFDFTGSAELPDIIAPWSDRVHLVTGEIDLNATERSNGQRSPAMSCAFLVRPDGYIAWAADSGTDGLPEALASWLGQPALANAA